MTRHGFCERSQVFPSWDAEPKGDHIMVKKAYTKPALRRLGLLRQVTRFSF